MIEKIVNWWLTGIFVLLLLMLTFAILVTSIIATCVFNNALWLLLNIIYLFSTPVLILGWEEMIKLIKNGGVL